MAKTPVAKAPTADDITAADDVAPVDGVAPADEVAPIPEADETLKAEIGGPPKPPASEATKVEVVAVGEPHKPAEAERKGLCAIDPTSGGSSLILGFAVGLAFVRRRR